MNGVVEASWEGSAPQDCDFSGNNFDAAASDARQQTGPNLSLAPLLATPAHVTSGPEGRADLLRRALTASPWRLLAPRQTAHGPPAGASRRGGAERSCHAAIGSVTAVISTGPTIGDISVPGRGVCRSSASAASHRSLFTVDGLPEPLPPDPPFLTLTGSAHPHPHPCAPAPAAAAAGDVSGSGSRRGGTRPLQHAATMPLAALAPPRRQGVQQHHTQSHTHTQPQPQPQAERSWHRLAGRGSGSAGPSAQNGLPYTYETAVDGPFLAESGSTEAGLRPRAPQPHLNPHHPPRTAPTASPGPLGSVNAPPQLPGGPDVFVRQGQPLQTAAVAAGLEPLPAAVTAPPATATAAAAAAVSAGGNSSEAPGDAVAAARQASALASPAHLHWDDARNPMSFNYDPSLHPGPPAQSGASQQCRTELPYDFHSRQGDAGSASLAPAGPAPGAGTTSSSRGAAADAAADGGTAGGDGAELLASEGSFVVLQMKGPRGTPSTHAAAAAAFASGASASPAAPDAAAAEAGMSLTLRGRVASYFSKWVGVGDTLMPSDQPVDIVWSWVGAFLSILAVAALNEFLTPHVSLPLMIASFGASAVLLFGVPASKLAQPRNFLGGQVVSALVGVSVRLVFMHAPHLVWLSAALGMSTALAVMQLTRTVHPPGGASALIAASAPYIGPWYGFKFVLTVFFGSAAMLLVALGINNLSARRRYPTYWMGK